MMLGGRTTYDECVKSGRWSRVSVLCLKRVGGRVLLCEGGGVVMWLARGVDRLSRKVKSNGIAEILGADASLVKTATEKCFCV